MIKRKVFLQLVVILVTFECCYGENVGAEGLRRRIMKRKKPGIAVREDVEAEKTEAEIKRPPLVARDSVIKKRKKKPEVFQSVNVNTKKKEEDIQHIPFINDEDKLVAKKSGINKRKKKPEVTHTQRENIDLKENDEGIQHIPFKNEDHKFVAKESIIKKRKKKPGIVVREDTEAKAKKEGIKYIPLIDDYDRLVGSESAQSEEIVKVELPEIEKKEVEGMGNKEVPEMDIKEVPDMENKEVPEMESKEVSEMKIKEAPEMENKEIPEMESKEVSEMKNKEVPEMEIKGVEEVKKKKVPGKKKKEEKVEEVDKIEKEVEKVVVVQKVEQKQVEEKVDNTPKERIVTEWMLFRTGVPVDYSYSENVTNPGDIVSVPGCPKSIDGYPWVLYGKPQPKCYLVGQRSSVCQGSAMMNYQRGSEYGVCACNFQECLEKRGLPSTTTSEGELLTNANLLRRRNGVPGKLRYRFCRPLGVTCEEFVYDQKEKRCDIMYTQGPCKEGEWLQRNSKGGVECAPRLCEDEGGLSEKSETFQRSYGNVTKDNAECCRSWGGFAVASIITSLTKLTSCDAGQVYSETLNKCITPFRASGLTVG